MIAPFNRRDSGCAGIVAGLVADMAALALVPGVPLAMALAGLAVLVVAVLVRTLPPDLPLRRAPDSAVRRAAAPPPPGLARLRVALLPEPLGWSRLDLYLDGVRVAQLRPGTAVVLPVLPGAHVLTIQAWLRRLGAREMINAQAGTDFDVVVRASGGRSRQYAIERRDLAPVLLDPRIVLLDSS